MLCGCFNPKDGFFLSQYSNNGDYCLRVYANESDPSIKFLEINNLKNGVKDNLELSRLPVFIYGFNGDTIVLQYYHFVQDVTMRYEATIEHKAKIPIKIEHVFYNIATLNRKIVADSLVITKGSIIFFQKGEVVKEKELKKIIFDGKDFLYSRFDGARQVFTEIKCWAAST